MFLKRITCILVFILHLFSAVGQALYVPGLQAVKITSDSLLIPPVRPWRAAGLVAATNLTVWSFDRYVLDAPFARINAATMKRNFQVGMVWDNDMFETNLFYHPYHGGLYFNTARANGLNFWKSLPSIAGGSLMWEFLMENEPASVNDFIATTIGGASLGEITYRISDLLVDNRTLGFGRFMRETAIFLVSPVRSVNRIITGDAFRVRTIRGNSLFRTPVVFNMATGYRWLYNEMPDIADIRRNIWIGLGLYYGDPFDPDNEKPYDFFSLHAGGNMFSEQRFISNVNALGMLFSRDFGLRNPDNRLLVGLFQHFNYYQATSDLRNDTWHNPYKISEAASLGPGLMLKTNIKGRLRFRGAAHLSAILLGGSQTDYYKYDMRDYNMGSGFSSKLNLRLFWGDKVRLMLNSEDYRIYSWIGYNENEFGEISPNVQGDICRASLSVLSLNFNYSISRHIMVGAESGYYFRKSVYEFYPTVNHLVSENKITLGYIF